MVSIGVAPRLLSGVNLVTLGIAPGIYMDGNDMGKCRLVFGEDECRKAMVRDRCLDDCRHLKKLTHTEMVDIITKYLLKDSEVIRAREDEQLRGKIIQKMLDTTDRIVDAVLRSTNNPRLISEAEDIKAAMQIVIDISIDSFDMTKSSFRTHLTWLVRGELANYLRKLLADKRSINFYHIAGSLQDVLQTSDGEEGTYAEIVGKSDYEFETIAIREFLDELSGDEQQVIRLMLGGYKAKEIFDILGISIIEVHEIIASIELKTTDFLEE